MYQGGKKSLLILQETQKAQTSRVIEVEELQGCFPILIGLYQLWQQQQLQQSQLFKGCGRIQLGALVQFLDGFYDIKLLENYFKENQFKCITKKQLIKKLIEFATKEAHSTSQAIVKLRQQQNSDRKSNQNPEGILSD